MKEKGRGGGEREGEGKREGRERGRKDREKRGGEWMRETQTFILLW